MSKEPCDLAVVARVQGQRSKHWWLANGRAGVLDICSQENARSSAKRGGVGWFGLAAD